MKISIIGASAGVGLEATRQALQQGHQVTTLSRRLDTLPDHPMLTKIQGSSTNPNDLKTAVMDVDAILVTLGTGNSTKATTLYSESAQNLIQVLREIGSTAPLIVLTGFGAGDSWNFNSILMKILFNLFLKAVYADKTKMEQLISTGYSNWEIVRPGRLINGAGNAHYSVLDSLSKGMKVDSISRADVAHFMVLQAENPTYIGKYPAITSIHSK
jgi:putative NADH-flavin reductase